MQTRNRIIAAFASAMLVGATFAPAAALTVNLNNGVHLNGSPTATGLNVNTGSGNTVASVGSHAYGTDAAALITTSKGDLVDLNTKKKKTSGTVNLGGVDRSGLDPGNIDVGDLLGIGAVTIPPVVVPPAIEPPPTIKPPPAIVPPGVSGGFADLSGGDQALLKIKCRSVLINPAAFESNVVGLCRLIAQIGPTG